MNAPPRWTTRLALLLLLAAGACSLPDRGRLIERRTKDDLSEREVRATVNAHLLRYAGVVEFTTHEALGYEKDPEIRMALLLWQINGIPACRSAAFLDDPLVAALDCWVLGLQELDYFQTAQAKLAFGPAQPFILERLRELHGNFERVLLSQAPKPQELQTRIAEFVREHPMKSLSYARESIAADAARITGDPELSAYAAVGTLDERMQEMAERLNIYAQQIPKQMLASAAIVKEGVTRTREFQSLLKDANDINRNLARLSSIEERLPAMIQTQVALAMEGLPAAMEPVTQMLTRERELIFEAATLERETTLEELDRQRLETQAFVREERVALQATVDETLNRMTLFVDRKNDDIETLLDQKQRALRVDADSISASTVEQINAAMRERIEQLAWSLLAVGTALSGVFFLTRILAGRASRPTD